MRGKAAGGGQFLAPVQTPRQNALRDHLKKLVAFDGPSEGDFSARRRHLDAIERARGSLLEGRRALRAGQAADLLAEDLRQAQLALAEITGEFSADDLLGEIFSRFCIGK